MCESSISRRSSFLESLEGSTVTEAREFVALKLCVSGVLSSLAMLEAYDVPIFRENIEVCYRLLLFFLNIVSLIFFSVCVGMYTCKRYSIR